MVTGHPIASAPASRRRSSRPTSAASGLPHRPSVALHSLSRHASVDSVLDRDVSDSLLPPTLNSILREGDEGRQEREQQQAEDGHSFSLWSVSTTKRYKCGRKGMGMMSSMGHFQTSELLASVSQTFVYELSDRYALPPLLLNHSPIYPCRLSR